MFQRGRRDTQFLLAYVTLNGDHFKQRDGSRLTSFPLMN